MSGIDSTCGFIEEEVCSVRDASWESKVAGYLGLDDRVTGKPSSKVIVLGDKSYPANVLAGALCEMSDESFLRFLYLPHVRAVDSRGEVMLSPLYVIEKLVNNDVEPRLRHRLALISERYDIPEMEQVHKKILNLKTLTGYSGFLEKVGEYVDVEFEGCDFEVFFGEDIVVQATLRNGYSIHFELGRTVSCSMTDPSGEVLDFSYCQKDPVYRDKLMYVLDVVEKFLINKAHQQDRPSGFRRWIGAKVAWLTS